MVSFIGVLGISARNITGQRAWKGIAERRSMPSFARSQSTSANVAANLANSAKPLCLSEEVTGWQFFQISPVLLESEKYSLRFDRFTIA